MLDRTLILCFDGTSNEFDDTNTNIVKLCSVLQMDRRDQQLVYYQPGIGTWTEPGIHGHIQRWFAKTADLAVAWYLSGHVMGGYKFLMENHHLGDRICIFGFSRGAYTARALAGMLHCVGLLSKGNDEQVTFAYRIYKGNIALADKFKRTFCKKVQIDFLGVWDTVASVGFLVPRTLPFVSNETIKTFRHAVSLDEHRTKFAVTLWKPETEVTEEGCPSDDSKAATETCGVEEMWFAGCHGDVGGGNVADGTNPDLSNISLRWMLHEIFKAKCGIFFDDEALDTLKVPYDCVPRTSKDVLQMESKSSSDTAMVGKDQPSDEKADDKVIPSWREADCIDAVAQSHDALRATPIWWLLQVPCWTGKRVDWTGQRIFPEDDTRLDRSSIHWTVVERMKGMKGYSPRAYLPD